MQQVNDQIGLQPELGWTQPKRATDQVSPFKEQCAIGGCHAVVRINHSFCFNTLILTFINSVTYLNCNNIEFLINKVLDGKLLVSLLIKYAISLTNNVYFYFYFYLFFVFY